MTTLAFDGIDDYLVSGDPGTALDGAVSVFAIVRRDGAPASTYETIFNGSDSGGGFGWFLAFEYDPGTGTHRICTWDNNVNRYSTTALDEGNRDWWILGLTKASGAAVPRFHMKNLTQDTAWTHEDGAGTNTFESISGGALLLGNATSGSLTYDFKGLMGLCGLWDVVLTDAQVEELSANSRTSDWWGNSGGQPLSLAELTSTSPTDLAALISWSPNGTPVSGVTTSATDPPGWTFDGQGGAVPAILRVLAQADTTLTLSAQEETALDLTATPETVLRVYG